MDYKKLIQAAMDAKEFAYAPYSGFCVGAALLTRDGRIFSGCNIENAAYSPTICAERTAVFKAVSEGCRDFQAIVVAGDHGNYLTPCGVCRQVLAEFCEAKTFSVILANHQDDYRIMTLEELLPGAFGKESLKKA